jgi:hypothetical protein|tara:strand:- start:739 stop:1548 length:810 start_codon:yes stop_codon:yes gene_type:complete
MTADIEKGIGFLLGHEEPETKRVRDLHYLNKVKQLIAEPPQVSSEVSLEVDPIGEILARTAPVLDLTSKTEETKEANGFKSQKEYEDYLVSRPSKTQHVKAQQEGKRILEDKKLIKWALEESPVPIVKNPVMKKAIRNKWANEWMTGGGYDHNARSLKQEEKLGKDIWLEKQKALKKHHQPKPKVMPVTTYIDKMNVAYSGQEKRKIDDRGKPIDTSKGSYIPWYERMAQEEAESLNNIKRSTWEQGGRVRPEPKYVTAQDVKNVYEKE